MERKNDHKDDESSDMSTVFTASTTNTCDIEDPYGLLKSEHIAAAAEDAAVLSRKQKGRKRKYNTEEEKREANRKLAATSRQKKKAYIEHLTQEIDNLRKGNDSLRKENELLRVENKNLQVDKSQYSSASLNPVSALSHLYSQQVQALLSPSLLHQNKDISSVQNIQNTSNINREDMKRSFSLAECLPNTQHLPSCSSWNSCWVANSGAHKSVYNLPDEKTLKKSANLEQVLAKRQHVASLPNSDTSLMNQSSLPQSLTNTLERTLHEIDEKRRRRQLLDDMTAQYISSLRHSQG